jgi:predicted DsbA family dithiol-disulfide isomerase
MAPPAILFSDFTCPFSYVTEIALRRLTAGAEQPLEYRAYQLYPPSVPLPSVPPAISDSEALQSIASELDLEIEVPGFLTRTGKAHEAARFARQRGFENELRDAIFRAYWVEGQDIGRIDLLLSLLAVPDTADELRIALDIDLFTDDVVSDRRVAERLGIRFTPTLIVGTGDEARYAVGAQPLDTWRELLLHHG